ncbi:MAG: hypothetical protein IT428_23760 [Planctomycetaceae bacterium]|nr:hypothetical protein [Planctomycetaceae bacterium]
MSLSLRMTFRTPLLVAGLLALLPGCHSVGKVNFDENCQIEAERIEIHYVLDGYRGGYWSRALMLNPPSEGGGINEMPEANPATTCQRAELHVMWPHPECQPGMARAIIRLWHRGQPEPVHRPKLAMGRSYGKFLHAMDRRVVIPEEMPERCEQKPQAIAPSIYTLDFARSELDLILPDLVCAGYFTDQWRPNGGTRLIIQIDDKRYQKEWTCEPRLDDLLTRVSEDGRRFLPADPSSKPDTELAPPPSPAEEPGRSKLDDVPSDLSLPPSPDDPNEPDFGPRRSKSPPSPVRKDPEARPIPLPPEPTPAAPEPDPEPSVPPFEDAPVDDALPPPLQSELDPRPRAAAAKPMFDEE